jgi:16S rRNA (guanine(1405)-N(7))-methyltransferase
MPQIELPQVLSSLSESRRYRHIAPSLLTRLAAEEIPKSKNQTDAEKRTKRRLHQIFGAYATPLRYDKLLDDFRATQHDPTLFKQTCANILRRHASTAERLADLENFYAPIFAITGHPNSILDLACGFNPLTIPWMPLPPQTTYLAADIDTEMIRFLDEFLKLTGINGQAITNDLIAAPPDQSADIALLLKSLPCLQHQTKNLLTLLDNIRANWLVVSFPTRSLGNRNKGMTATYRAFLIDLIKPRDWKAHEILFPSELVFVIGKNLNHSTTGI